MLYTVKPLESVYANPRRDDEIKKEFEKKMSEAEFKDIQLQHGRVVTRRDGESYVVERINSTNMSDYLNDDYSPGKTVK